MKTPKPSHLYGYLRRKTLSVMVLQENNPGLDCVIIIRVDYLIQ